MRIKPIERQRRMIRQEFIEHAKNVKKLASLMPSTTISLLKGKWNAKAGIEIMVLGLYSTGLIIVGTALYSLMYIGVMEP